MASSALALSQSPVCSEMQLISKGEAWFIEQEDPLRPCVEKGYQALQTSRTGKNGCVENLAMCLMPRAEALNHHRQLQLNPKILNIVTFIIVLSK